MSSKEGAVTTSPLPPDAGSIRGDDWPRRSFPAVKGARAPGFSVVFDRSVLHGIYVHGRGSADVEVCGVLVGMVGCDEHGPFVHVQDSIRGDHASNQAGQVTFTAATWDHIQRAMDRRAPDDRVVGWYHTHPDFGIFLSSMDRFIHQHFFDLPWQLAFVFDPIRQQEGLFVWRSGEPVEEAFVMHENIPSSDLPHVVLKGPPRSMGPEPLDRWVELGQRLTGLERRQFWLSAGLVIAVVIGLFWPLALFLMRTGRAETPPAQVGPAYRPVVPAPPDDTDPADVRPSLPKSWPSTARKVAPPPTRPQTPVSPADPAPSPRPEKKNDPVTKPAPSNLPPGEPKPASEAGASEADAFPPGEVKPAIPPASPQPKSKTPSPSK